MIHKLGFNLYSVDKLDFGRYQGLISAMAEGGMISCKSLRPNTRDFNTTWEGPSYILLCITFTVNILSNSNIVFKQSVRFYLVICFHFKQSNLQGNNIFLIS